MKEGIHIALAPEQLGTLFGIPITNTLITSWVVVALLLIFGLVMRQKIRFLPGRFQTLLESGLEYVLSYMEDVLEDKKKAIFFFPFIVSIFVFIFASNMFEFLPGVGSIGLFRGEEFIPLFRSVNTDLNVTLALAIISMLVIQIVGITTLGLFHYLSNLLALSRRWDFSSALLICSRRQPVSFPSPSGSSVIFSPERL